MSVSRIAAWSLAVLALSGCGGEPPAVVNEDCIPSADLGELGLEVQILEKGYGRAACIGDELTMHTTGWLYDENAENGRGEKFWSSLDGAGEPFSFVLGEGRVIQGWDLTSPGMLIGETRQIRIPPKLGYGGRASGPIPANSTLVFEIKLLRAEGPGDAPAD